MTPREVAASAAHAIHQGLEETDNPAGFWLVLLDEMSAYCESHLGPEAARQVFNTLHSLRGSMPH